MVTYATGGGHVNIDGIEIRVEDSKSTIQLTPILPPDGRVDPEDVRAWYAADPYRPQYHFSARTNWINDPNGLIQWNGKYHLFYQHHPYNPEWGPMHWGHAISDDLVHWRHLPIALAPDKSDLEGDMSGIFSGSAVDDDGTLTLMYTDYTDTEKHPGKQREVQSIATSVDGITFTKYEGNPVIDKPPAEATAGFRDPKVWKDEDGLWKVVIGSGHNGRGKVLLYSSPDLRRWTYLGPLFEGDGTTGAMWECPDFFRLGERYVLLISVNDPNLYQTTLYFVGDYRDNRFIPERSGLTDFGPDFYAAQTFGDSQGRRIMIGWMNRWGASMPTKAHGWAGAMSLPRELFLLPDGDLGIRPVPELKALRSLETPAYHMQNLEVLPDAAGLPDDIEGDTLEILAEFEVDPCRAGNLEAFGLKLRRSPDGMEETVVGYDPRARVLFVDRSKSGVGDGGRFERRLELADDLILKLHVFVDRSSVEVFANDGRAVGSVRVYPRWKESRGVELFANGGKVIVKSIDIWKLDSAWENP